MRIRLGWMVCLAACVAIGSSGCRDESDVIALKLAHSLDATHPVHKAMQLMADRVAEESNGTMRIDIYPSGQLGSEKECIEQVQLGILAMTKTSSGPLEGFVPELQVFGLPYLFRDSDHMWKVFDGPIGERLLEASIPKRIKGLCYYDAGARSFYTVDRRIETPGDLAGMKIRVQKSVMSTKMIEAMGGSPTPIDFGELYTALEQGVVDGAENNPPSFYRTSHYRLCKYYILDEHLRLPDMLIINPAIWDGLTADQQQILSEAVDESVVYQRELWAADEAKAMEEVAEAKVTIIRPDKAPFVEAVQPVWKSVDPVVYDLAQRILQVE